MIVLDVSVLIAHFDARDIFHTDAAVALAAGAASPFRASVVTLAEVLFGPTRAGVLPTARRAVDALGVEPVVVGSNAPERLAVLRAETGLKLPDCCVLLAAQDVDADVVLTFDERLRRAAAAGFAVG